MVFLVSYFGGSLTYHFYTPHHALQHVIFCKCLNEFAFFMFSWTVKKTENVDSCIKFARLKKCQCLILWMFHILYLSCSAASFFVDPIFAKVHANRKHCENSMFFCVFAAALLREGSTCSSRKYKKTWMSQLIPSFCDCVAAVLQATLPSKCVHLFQNTVNYRTKTVLLFLTARHLTIFMLTHALPEQSKIENAPANFTILLLSTPLVIHKKVECPS